MMRARFECLFGVNLAAVRIHRSPQADCANAALGSVAFAVGEHVCLASWLDDLGGRLREFVLAHEVAHVVQNRRWQPGAAVPDRRAIEAEADAAARDVLAGRPARIALSNDPAVARCWGPAGHYWTVFLTAIAAGVPEQDAYSCAFYTQLPDQVRELDAVPRGYDAKPRDVTDQIIDFFNPDVPDHLVWNVTSDAFGTPSVNLSLVWSPLMTVTDSGARIRDRIIQRGLHCLTGRTARVEFPYRRQILMDCDKDSFDFKLALHPFGDCFAHRKSDATDTANQPEYAGVMYPDPMGHGLDSKLGHDPDDIRGHLNMYLKYGEILFGIFQEKWKAPARMQMPEFQKTLELVPWFKDEDARCGFLRGQLSNIVSDKSLLNYRPEAEFGFGESMMPFVDSIPWVDFFGKTNHPALNPPMVASTEARAEQCAALWTPTGSE